jgi:hypothetical protein
VLIFTEVFSCFYLGKTNKKFSQNLCRKIMTACFVETEGKATADSPAAKPGISGQPSRVVMLQFSARFINRKPGYIQQLEKSYRGTCFASAADQVYHFSFPSLADSTAFANVMRKLSPGNLSQVAFLPSHTSAVEGEDLEARSSPPLLEPAQAQERTAAVASGGSIDICVGASVLGLYPSEPKTAEDSGVPQMSSDAAAQEQSTVEPEPTLFWTDHSSTCRQEGGHKINNDGTYRYVPNDLPNWKVCSLNGRGDVDQCHLGVEYEREKRTGPIEK